MPEKDVALVQHQAKSAGVSRCRVAVIWIDWYAYHLARFKGLAAEKTFAGHVAGIELVGGIGVHSGLKFREDLPAGLPISTLMPNESWAKAGELRLAWKLWSHLNELRPEMLLVPGYYTAPALAAALWAKTHGAVSTLMTESTSGDHQRSSWKEAVKGLLIRRLFDKAVTGGVAHRRYLSELGFSERNVAGFYDVVDNLYFLQAAQKYRANASANAQSLPAKYFLYIGRLAPEKNIEGLLKSYLAYRAEGGTWALVLVGDGPSATALQQAAIQAPCAQDVIFAGHRGTSELPVYYAFATCFVLPSIREPWGLVVNEAAASALPLLVSRKCGCAEDLVTERNGYSFNPTDHVELTSLLRRMEQHSEAELAAMGAASLEGVSGYSPSNFGKEVARLYTSAFPPM